MRQFFTWGFWLSLVALAGLTFGLLALVRDDTTPAAFVPVSLPDAPPERAIDLIALVYLAQAEPGFDIVDGRTTASMQIRIDGFRYMNIPAGTPGENRCAALTELASCAVAVDLLGEAVLWFSIVPLEPRFMVSLPAVAELREGERVLLANGWLVKRAETVKRVCDDDTTSLTDFIDRHAEGSITTFSLDEQQVVSVTCSDGTSSTSSTTPSAPASPRL